tara:strand:- start:101 stop:1195 length:1095 start_codon:yes stop_codon:yes gene_type:complete
MDGENNPIMPRPINYLVSSAIDNTSAHQNIDTLLLQSKLDEQIKNESLYGAIYADKTPEYKGGIDPVVENIALSPIIALKSLGSVGKKILEKSGLRNPLYHYTSSAGASKILEQGFIKGSSEAFQGKPFKGEMTKFVDPKNAPIYQKKMKSPAVSVTRDPAFLTRGHQHVKTDISFISDKPSLKSKGYKIQPFAEKGYRKTLTQLDPIDAYHKFNINMDKPFNKTIHPQMNPRFEFEERIRGNLSLEDIKMINVSRLPGKFKENKNLLTFLEETNIPVIFSKGAKKKLKRFKDDIHKKKNVMEKLGSNNPSFSSKGYNPDREWYARDKNILNSLLKYTSYKNPLKHSRYNQPTLKQPKHIPLWK